MALSVCRSFLKQNIPNKSMDDAYYSETSPSDTGLIILSVQSMDTLAYLEDYQISNL